MKTVLALCTLALVACGDDSGSSDSPDLSAHLAPDLANTDMTGFMLVEKCDFIDYIDQTQASGTVTVSPWDTTLGKKCLLIHVGQTVSWAASTSHPLEATTGTTPTPIPIGATTPQSIKFDAEGTYGYECQVHTSLMHGAIWVVR
jgi:hypothetical protein